MTASSRLRTLLVLGRVSNVPTVWSNCLAGWLLGGGSNKPFHEQEYYDWVRFALLCMGATLLYVGGMFLNDALDADFDSQHRRERPIPSGAIAEKAVWRIGIALLVGGMASLIPLGITTSILAVLLCTCIVLYDVVHKVFTVSPVLMALCRVLLYLAAASAAVGGITGLAMWSALALGFYVVGLSYVARKEALGVKIEVWPQFLLVIPVLLALLVNDGPFRESGLLFAAIASLWIIRSLRSLWMQPHNVARAVSGLLAGIVWIDLLSVADEPRLVSAIFVSLFLLALGFQRLVPAT